MPKQGDIDYLGKLSAAEVEHATDKPFADAEFAKHLIDLGAVATLLPPPPARLLDLGCGTGWTSCFLARHGYEVVGQDIAPDMIARARFNQERYEVGEGLSFVVADYEDLGFHEEFDAALFFDSLHHAEDEKAALRMVWRALRPGGVCVTSEPGKGHARSPQSMQAVRLYQVTERDMPTRRIIRAAKGAGFTDFRTYAHLSRWAAQVYRRPPARGARRSLTKRIAWSLVPGLVGWLKAGIAWKCSRDDDGGVVFMRKGCRKPPPRVH
jgi:SAM-dependent methyltransferase